MGILARSEPRDGYAVRVLAVHTTEGPDHPQVDDARALRDATWWTGSSHAIADNDPGVLLTPAQGMVPYDRAAWTLRSGNRWSENIELVAFASWTREQWLDRPVLLDLCARWLADRSKARGIPLRKLTPEQYAAGWWGVIGHVDHTVGYHDGTHWDPGPHFPWDLVINKARAYAAGQEEDIVATIEELRKVIREEVGDALIAPTPGGIGGDQPRSLQAMLGRGLDDGAESRRMLGVLLGWNAPATELERAALEKMWGGAVDVDEKAVAAAFIDAARPMFLEVVREALAADNGAEADAIVDRFVARLTA